MNKKDPNPKDAPGIVKPPVSTVSFPVLFEVGAAMLEGCKYGRHNYRAMGVTASIYLDAAMRHLGSWWEGEDIDPDSGLHHVTKAIASLFVLRDAMIAGTVQDDRPPRVDGRWMTDVKLAVDGILEKYKGKFLPPYTEVD